MGIKEHRTTLLAAGIAFLLLLNLVVLLTRPPDPEDGSPTYRRAKSSWIGDACSYDRRFAEACEVCKQYDGPAFWDCRLDEIRNPTGCRLADY